MRAKATGVVQAAALLGLTKGLDCVDFGPVAVSGRSQDRINQIALRPRGRLKDDLND